jgi:hypothetical protein
MRDSARNRGGSKVSCGDTGNTQRWEHRTQPTTMDGSISSKQTRMDLHKSGAGCVPYDAGFSCSVAAWAAFAYVNKSWSQLQRSMYNASHTRGTRCSPLPTLPIYHHQTNTGLTNKQELRTHVGLTPKGAACRRKTDTPNCSAAQTTTVTRLQVHGCVTRLPALTDCDVSRCIAEAARASMHKCIAVGPTSPSIGQTAHSTN